MTPRPPSAQPEPRPSASSPTSGSACLGPWTRSWPPIGFRRRPRRARGEEASQCPRFLFVRGNLCVPEAIRHRGHRVCRDRIGNPMPYDPYALCHWQHRWCLVKCIARRSPLPAGFLARQNKTGSPRARHLAESRSQQRPSEGRAPSHLAARLRRAELPSYWKTCPRRKRQLATKC